MRLVSIYYSIYEMKFPLFLLLPLASVGFTGEEQHPSVRVQIKVVHIVRPKVSSCTMKKAVSPVKFSLGSVPNMSWKDIGVCQRDTLLR